MAGLPLIDPKDVKLKYGEFVISVLPAMVWREIAHYYTFQPQTVKFSDLSPAILKMFSFACKKTPNGDIRLDSEMLVNQHVYKDDVAKLEKAMIGYNFDFLTDGELINRWQGIQKWLESYCTKTLTQYLDTWLQKAAQNGMNSGQFTPGRTF